MHGNMKKSFQRKGKIKGAKFSWVVLSISFISITFLETILSKFS